MIYIVGAEDFTAIANPRPVVDKSYHVGITVTFKSNDDLKRYLVHPIHKNFVKTYVKDHLEKLVIYDF